MAAAGPHPGQAAGVGVVGAEPHPGLAAGVEEVGAEPHSGLAVEVGVEGVGASTASPGGVEVEEGVAGALGQRGTPVWGLGMQAGAGLPPH